MRKALIFSLVALSPNISLVTLCYRVDKTLDKPI